MDYEYERGTNQAIIADSKRGHMRLPHDYLVESRAITREEFYLREVER